MTIESDVYRAFEQTAAQLDLTICRNPGASDCRIVPVRTIADETTLRYQAWIDANRARVNVATGGRAAYVHLPDTAVDGYRAFNRFFLGQSDKRAAVIDARFNQGGFVPDVIIDTLRRSVGNYWTSREGAEFATPRTGVFGPKVLLINQYTESGGEALAWYFRTYKLGTSVGTKTWGGLVGSYGGPALADGGEVLIPRIGFWTSTAGWIAEGHGIEPDVVVADDGNGADPQLEKALAIVDRALDDEEARLPKRPRYPVTRR